MKNGEFKIDRKSKTIVFCQVGHGQRYYGKSKCNPSDEFDVIKGQLIAMKRCELNMRKDAIASTKAVIEFLNVGTKFGAFNIATDISAVEEGFANLDYQDLNEQKKFTDGFENKLLENYIAEAHETLRKHYHHVKELQNDIERLYDGTYTYPHGNLRYETINGSMQLVRDHDDENGKEGELINKEDVQFS